MVHRVAKSQTGLSNLARRHVSKLLLRKTATGWQHCFRRNAGYSGDQGLGGGRGKSGSLLVSSSGMCQKKTPRLVSQDFFPLPLYPPAHPTSCNSTVGSVLASQVGRP